MLRLLTVVLMLLLGPALPAAAQKADSESKQALRQSIETICRRPFLRISCCPSRPC